MMLADHPVDKGGSTDFTFHERDAVGHGFPPTGAQVVHHRHPIPGLEKGKDGVAADVTGAAGDEDGFSRQCGGLRERLGRSVKYTPKKMGCPR